MELAAILGYVQGSVAHFLPSQMTQTVFDVRCSSSVVLPVTANSYDSLVAAVVTGLDGIRYLNPSELHFVVEGGAPFPELGVLCQSSFEGACALQGPERRISLSLRAPATANAFLFDHLDTSGPSVKGGASPASLDPSHVSEVVHRAHTLMSGSAANPSRLSPTRLRPKESPPAPEGVIGGEMMARVQFPGESKSVTVVMPHKLRELWQNVADATQYLFTRGSHRMVAVRRLDGMEVDIDDDEDIATVAALMQSGGGDVYIQLIDACREGARLQKKRTVVRSVVSPLRNISNVSVMSQVD